MISKELLREVLGEDRATSCNKLEMETDNSFLVVDDWITINIYELAHKCKEWAYKRGFLYWYENSRLFIKIMYSCKVDFVLDIGEYKKPFEIDIDFKACQWILDNKED